MHFPFLNIKFDSAPTKTMKYIIIFVTILSLTGFSLPLFAQHKAQSKKPYRKPNYEEDWDFNNRFAIKLTPTSLLDPYGALLPLGVEYYLNNKYGFSLDFGLPLYYSLNNQKFDNYKHINSDFKVRADIRHYFRFRRKSRLFYGGEVFYRNQNMSLNNSYFHFINNHCYEFTEGITVKNIFGFGFFMGRTQKLSEHFSLESYLGIGLRIINMSPQMDFSNTPYYFRGSFVSLEMPNEDRVGDHDLNIYLPFAIKISYLF